MSPATRQVRVDARPAGNSGQRSASGADNEGEYPMRSSFPWRVAASRLLLAGGVLLILAAIIQLVSP
jgi:hypothetical protein